MSEFERRLMDHQIAWENECRAKRDGNSEKVAYCRGQREAIGDMLDQMRK